MCETGARGGVPVYGQNNEKLVFDVGLPTKSFRGGGAGVLLDTPGGEIDRFRGVFLGSGVKSTVFRGSGAVFGGKPGKWG